MRTRSHLMGFFYRTIRMVDHGIKPCYIFDGKPPELKGGVVSRVESSLGLVPLALALVRVSCRYGVCLFLIWSGVRLVRGVCTLTTLRCLPTELMRCAVA
jgi:hypothetical protein